MLIMGLFPVRSISHPLLKGRLISIHFLGVHLTWVLAKFSQWVSLAEILVSGKERQGFSHFSLPKELFLEAAASP